MATVSVGTTTTASPKVRPTTPASITDHQRQQLREQERIDFYRTYDVMTGVRIAATLGGFFGLMVILVLYKSKSKTEKVLTDPKLAQAVVEAEEERQLNIALEATEMASLGSRAARMSLGNTSAPLLRYTRFSSIGDPSYLLAPPHASHQHRFFLDVPEASVSRRASNTTTCSSSISSYLERRNSSVLGMHPPITIPSSIHSRRRQSSPVPWDAYYPDIDIRVIQPTPGGSPCGSERTLCGHQMMVPHHNKLAPLASISSCASSLLVDYPDLDARSLGELCSDSVFLDDDECLDTEDEVTQFSTDSDSDTLNECDPSYQLTDRGSLILKPSSSVDVEDGTWSQETLF